MGYRTQCEQPHAHAMLGLSMSYIGAALAATIDLKVTRVSPEIVQQPYVMHKLLKQRS